jgi:hypothetical protein
MSKHTYPIVNNHEFANELVQLRDILGLAPHSRKFLVVNTSSFVHIIVCSPMQRNTFVTGHIIVEHFLTMLLPVNVT